MENKKYSLLIIALYCYSGHIIAVINHLKEKNPLIDITLLTEKADEIKMALSNNSVKIEKYDVPPVLIKWRWLMKKVIKLKQCRFFEEFCKGRQYDIVNLHFPNMFMSYVYKDLRAMSDKLVITPWGSDILRRDKKYLNCLKGLYQKSDYIATSEKTPLGRRIVEVLEVEPTKLIGNFFGSDLVDYAMKEGLSITTDIAKNRLGLSGKYVITCGYNRREPQRHKSIIAAIDQVREQLPKNLILLFPMTYGVDTRENYVDECKNECKNRNLPAVFVTGFLSIEELYFLRKATDLFVHVQTTDANSSSVMEYILCDVKIVHGSWIKYEELESYKPLFYFPVDNIDDLGEAIVKACCSDKIEVSQEVLDYVKSFGWKKKVESMNNFFMSII